MYFMKYLHFCNTHFGMSGIISYALLESSSMFINCNIAITKSYIPHKGIGYIHLIIHHKGT